MSLDSSQYLTLLDVAQNDKGSGYAVISEAIHSHAEVNLFPVSTQTDTTLEVQVLESLPGGATFRRPNEGIPPTKTTYGQKRFGMAMVNRRVEVDKHGVYDRAKDKARLLINQSIPQAQKALSDIAKQIIYGTLDDTNKGFPGLIAQAADDTDHVVDATGTASKTSVWFLEVVPSAMELVFGDGSTLTMADDWVEETVTDSAGGKLKALTNELVGWVGFRLLNRNRAVRIKNIGTANGKTLTGAMMKAAIAKCSDELGFSPTHILGNGRSFEQLRLTRVTDLNPDPARLTDYDGIPIVRSINVSTSEA